MVARFLSASFVFATLAAPARAQVALQTEPDHPVRGTLIRLRVTPSLPNLVTAIEGRAAGEPLHLKTSDGVTWSGLLGIPVDGGDSMRVSLVLIESAARDTMEAAFAVAAGDYPSERIRVAPRMARPDSAGRAHIAHDIARARKVSREAQEVPQLWSAPFEPPRAGRITSPYGTARVFNGSVVSRHMGTDFHGRMGDPVRATNRGRVALVADFYLAGRAVYIIHGDGLVSAYFHLSRALVRPGQMVGRGQLIGEVGRSGRVTGPHLHWVMRYGGVTVDPESVLDLLGDEAQVAAPDSSTTAPDSAIGR